MITYKSPTLGRSDERRARAKKADATMIAEPFGGADGDTMGDMAHVPRVTSVDVVPIVEKLSLLLPLAVIGT
jgi:hypothetical protein